MIDLTKDLPLGEKKYRLYKRLQSTLYAIALVVALALSFLIVFPSKNLHYSFQSLGQNRGNALNPRSQDGSTSDGKLANQGELTIDATLIGTFSTTEIKLQPADDTASIAGSSLKAQKSYKAFFYPEAEPIGFKSGTLVKNENDYYLVSDEHLRKFETEALVTSLGYAKEAFVKASKADLDYNRFGEPITQQAYPDSTLFKVNQDYYQLNDGQLYKFVSPQAYSSHYTDQQAINKSADLLSAFPLADTLIGFADGSLIAYGTSAYVVSEDKVLPIDSAETYTGQGYLWDDLIRVSGDEFSRQTKDKLFSIYSAHPSGTIYLSKDDGLWYMIKNDNKHRLASAVIANSWLRKNPVIISSLGSSEACTIEEKSSLFESYYYCELPLSNLNNLIGFYYEFKLTPNNPTQLNDIDVTFRRDISIDNFKLVVKELLLKIKGKYVSQ